MTKSAKKMTKKQTSGAKSKKTSKDQTKAAEYVRCLLELHKLQGVLLADLKKQIK